MNGEPNLSPTAQLRAEAVRRLGFEIENLDPESGYLWEVRKGDQKRILMGAFSPHNSAIAARLAEDKFHTATLVRRLGYRVPDVARCLRPGRFEQEDFHQHLGIEPAHAFAAKHGFPLVVKPNRGARGRHVQVVDNTEAMVAAIERVWTYDYLALVQEVAHGIDVRLDYLGDDFLFGYLRRPVSLQGDGRSSLRQLLTAADRRFTGDAFWQQLQEDPIWVEGCRRQGVHLDSIVGQGQTLRFDTVVLNLNRLCLAEIVRTCPEDWLRAGLEIGHALGLRHFGIDFKAPSFEGGLGEATVLEVNASPSLVQMSRRGFYEEALAAETRIVEGLFDAP